MGPKARMTRPEGSGGGPAIAGYHPRGPRLHGGLAMANAETAVVDINEEDEDIL